VRRRHSERARWAGLALVTLAGLALIGLVWWRRRDPPPELYPATRYVPPGRSHPTQQPPRWPAALWAALRRGGTWLWAHPRLALAAMILAGGMWAGWRLTRPGARFGPQDGTWRRIQINQDLYVGIVPNYPPFAEWSPERPVGLEADIALEIGRRLGVETHFLLQSDDSLYDSLFIGETDFIISGLHVDPGRTDWVHYTRPYFDAGYSLVSRAEAPVGTMRTLEGQTVAVEIASAGHVAAERQWKRRLHSLTVRPYLLPDDALRAVLDGDAAAALVDIVSARLFLAEHDGLVMADRPTISDQYVIAIRKKNFRLADEVDAILAAMIEDGTLDAIIDRWL
jgi:ABC-type amino acid transport substrate-binding protein